MVSSYLPDLDCHVPGAADDGVVIKEGSTADDVLVTGEHELGLAGSVVPDSEGVILAASDQVLVVTGELNASDAAAVAAEEVNLFGEEVTNTTLGHVRVGRAVQEDTVVEWNGLDAVNDIVLWLPHDLGFETLHRLSLFLKQATIFLVCFPNCGHRVMVELPLFRAWRLNIDDSDLALNGGDQDLITLRHEIDGHEHLVKVVVRVNGRLGVPQIPVVHQEVCTDSGRLRSVRRKGCFEAEVSVSIKHVNTLAVLDVPYSGCVVRRGTYQSLTSLVVLQSPNTFIVALDCVLDFVIRRIPDLDGVVVGSSGELGFGLRIGANCIHRVFVHVLLATSEGDDRMNFGNLEVSTILILHVYLLDAILKFHFVLKSWVLLEPKSGRIIHV